MTTSVEVARMLLPCPECCDERPFDQPFCEDGHGLDCPEWLCTDCGAALFVATYPEFDVPPARRALPELTARTAA
jgi:hypothetical protein